MGKQIIERFFEQVRSGKNVGLAQELMAAHVTAHQMTGELPAPSVVRTPAEYVRHVAELDAEHGGSTIELQELLAEGDRVFVRWLQRGTRATSLASAVYRVESGRIAEYWIQAGEPRPV